MTPEVRMMCVTVSWVCGRPCGCATLCVPSPRGVSLDMPSMPSAMGRKLVEHLTAPWQVTTIYILARSRRLGVFLATADHPRPRASAGERQRRAQVTSREALPFATQSSEVRAFVSAYTAYLRKLITVATLCGPDPPTVGSAQQRRTFISSGPWPLNGRGPR